LVGKNFKAWSNTDSQSEEDDIDDDPDDLISKPQKRSQVNHDVKMKE
jgi:hypothetical protein